MKLLHYVEIENFKRYSTRQRIDLDHPSVLIGPNNCGKTSILQAIALWSIGLRTWRIESEGSNAEKRQGKSLNRLNILSVPVPRTRHLWNNLKTTNRPLRITVAVDVGGQPRPITMSFAHHASDELVYCQPAKESLADEAAMAAAARVDVALLYPMSGISADEAVVLPKRVEFLLGRGSTAEVLRNICLSVQTSSASDWAEITGLMQRLFQVEIGVPVINQNGGVDLAYRQEGATSEMDLSLSGRGFQQMLLIFAYLYLHKRSVLLVDEPDAHLEILRQQQVYVLLRDIARRNGCQVVLVTHSEVLLNEALDRNLTLVLQGQVENLADRQAIKNSLKHFGAEHYVRAREAGHVLYLEGSTDVDMLRALARKLNHPAAALLDDGARLNTYYLQDNYPEAQREAEAELERVEGGYGLKPEEHFHGLRKMLPELRGLVIQDNDGRGRSDGASGELRKLVWKRYESENYFITPEVLLTEATRFLATAELFQQQPVQIMNELLREMIFDGSEEDMANYDRSDASTRKTLWRAQTQQIKLSTFAEEFFRRLAATTGTPMIHTKGSLHELVAACDPAELNGEVREKLDAIAALLPADVA